MKKFILSFLVVFAAGLTTSAIAQEIIQGAAIQFEEDVHDYGDIPHASNGTYSFVFKNIGTEPLLISGAKGSCGCTVPTWPQEPIAPGASAKLDVTYDTKRVGVINKSVTINSNAVNDPVKVIQIVGNVLPIDSEGPALEIIEETEVAAPVIEIEEVIEVPMTKAEIKAAAKEAKALAKAENKAAKKAAKAAKKAAKA